MMQVIQSTGIQHVDCAALFSPLSGGYYTECKHITSLMMSQKLYGEARKFAAISETPADHITLEQVSLKTLLTNLFSQVIYFCDFHVEEKFAKNKMPQKCWYRHSVHFSCIAEYCI